MASTGRRAHPIERRLYGLAFVDEFGPIYAVYTLWFNDNGITTAQVSTVFLVWALVGLALEIPSGALADRVDRRHLLGVAFAIRAAGIALWLVWPTLTGVLIGAVLWAVHDALASGSWEAMIHDQLRSEGRADRYGPVMARIGQWSHLGVAAGTLLGAGLLQIDTSLVTLGWLTVAAHAGSIALVTTLPLVGPDPSELAPADEDRSVDVPGSAVGRWLAVLRDGIGQVVVRSALARLVAVGALVEGLFIVDEYLPLLARAQGGSDAAAPVLVLVVWLGLLAGGEVAARWPRLAGRRLGPGLMAGTVVMAGALALGRVWALALVAVGYAVMQTTNVVANTRLQEQAPGPLRATVTSVRGFGSALVAMVMFVVIGAVADGDDPTPGLYVLLAVLAAVGILIMVWLPSPDPESESVAEAAGPDRT